MRENQQGRGRAGEGGIEVDIGARIKGVTLASDKMKRSNEGTSRFRLPSEA